MNEEPRHHHENARLVLQIVIALFMAIGAWFAKEVWNGQKTLASEFMGVRDQIARLDKMAAVTEANRFTAQDWMKASEAVTTRLAQTERRLDRHDDTLEQINITLKRLETALTK